MLLNKRVILPDKDPSTISVPHFDFVEDLALNVYKRVPQKIVHVFSWDLTSHVMKLGQNEAGVTPYETPVIRPSVFAIQVKTDADPNTQNTIKLTNT